jgi:tryptophan synthase alpha chain
MPYSDPLADGPVIQQSNTVALQNGITIKKIFEQLSQWRNPGSPLGGGGLPLILMGYLNPVMQFGIEKFCKLAKEVGVDGIILPDLPIYEFENEYKQYFEQNDLHFVFLITPETSEERIRKIDKLSKGFIYAVSSSSTTGNNKGIDQQENYFLKLQKMNLKNPILVGFGIKDKQTFQAACKYSNGAIIGSAYINALQTANNIDSATQQFLNKVLR